MGTTRTSKHARSESLNLVLRKEKFSFLSIYVIVRLLPILFFSRVIERNEK